MRPRRARWTVPVLFLSLIAVFATVLPAATQETAPTVRLFGVRDHVTAKRFGKRPVWVDLGAWVASAGGTFDLRVSRPDYRSPVDIRQVDTHTGEVLRDLPDDVLQGWSGLSKFFRLVVRTDEGKWVTARNMRFCPNAGEHQRVADTGPTNPRYPWSCGGGHPLIRGMVWGIDDGWAVSPMGWRGGVSLKVKPGEYTVRLSIRRPFADLLEVPNADRHVVVGLTVNQAKGFAGHRPARPQSSEEESSPESGVPDVTDPDPATLPDLVPLPGWLFETYHQKGRDYVAFAATEWNEGPGPLVVEGFRRSGEDIMDAYQYFYEGDTAVGRAPVGTLEYHKAPGHQHWHFEEFTEYTLLDGSHSQVALSGKQSWCLAPTDAIDLTVDGANWSPGSIGLESACGWAGSIWVREILDVGWGDTYTQFSTRQAFDITDLPNGRYFMQTEVNPTGVLHEGDASNNIELRRIRLRGKPGNRRVVVPPWKGIDTEGFYGGFFG